MIKNIDVFIKKKNYPLPSTNFQLECLFDDDERTKCQTESDDQFEVFLKKNSLTKEEFWELDKIWEDEIQEDIRKILILVEQQRKIEYEYFNNGVVLYKKGEKYEKIQNWLKNENVLKKLDLTTKNEKNSENHVFKEIVNLDEKYQRVLENHLKKIEEMKEILNNFTQEKENINEKIENYGDSALKIEKNDENKQNVKKNAVNEEKNRSKIEKTPQILEERVVLRSK